MVEGKNNSICKACLKLTKTFLVLIIELPRFFDYTKLLQGLKSTSTKASLLKIHDRNFQKYFFFVKRLSQ